MRRSPALFVSSLGASLTLGLTACGDHDPGGRAAAQLLAPADPAPADPLAAAPPEIVVGSDGKTAPTFSYQAAIRERVFIPVPGVDQNADGVVDRVAVDIVRPAETQSGLKVPAIVIPSPYFTSTGDGTEYLHTTDGGTADRVPMFYDNYFVPRGYAVLAAHALGTGFSTGCPLHGGAGDIAAMKAVIDWLQDRIPAYASVSATDSPRVADWDNGKAGMVGKSYDGALALGVGATRVAGLTTIVPISAVSDWYRYSRSNGIRFNTHYPNSLCGTITKSAAATMLGVIPPDNFTACAATRTTLNNLDGDATGDRNPFWAERVYDGAAVQTPVFTIHGINDDNVKLDQLTAWWSRLGSANVPRKLWLSLEGHRDPFDFRRAAWVETLHRWLDYWLHGVENGIMAEPRVDIESAKDVWTTASDWPLPGRQAVDVFFRGTTAGAPGALASSAGGPLEALTFTDRSTQNEASMINDPTGSQANRLVFLSPILSQDLHLSGEPVLYMTATLSTTQSNVGALIVDYGSGTHVTRTGDGLSTTTTESCWGDTLGLDDGCFPELTKPTVDVTSWRVSKGILDSSNRTSITDPTPVVAGSPVGLPFPLLPTEYVVPAGHRLGVILVGNYPGYSSVAGTAGAQITVDLTTSRIVLPVVGGSAALAAAFTPAPQSDGGADDGGGVTIDAGGITGDAGGDASEGDAGGDGSVVDDGGSDDGAVVAPPVDASGDGGGSADDASVVPPPTDAAATDGAVIASDAGAAADAGTDAASPATMGGGGGCSCDVAPASGAFGTWGFALVAAAVVGRRRRRS